MAKPASAVPERIRGSTGFYPYFKDCIGAIDGTHIPATVSGRDNNSYRNRNGVISQNVLAACNFDLEFIYVLSEWERSAHDSHVLTDALSRNNGLKIDVNSWLLFEVYVIIFKNSQVKVVTLKMLKSCSIFVMLL
ncbi:uncharacterized protein LOC142538707 [Primulina tabacum]|uniref:uncharacterized protein LOC142538707 n=1 Tax=Primulina tabacum TaxID=48773 RepID=UPI003F5ACF68